MGRPAIDMTGKRCGKLLVLERAESLVTPSGQKSARWLCRCDCGGEKVVHGTSLRSGITTSCGRGPCGHNFRHGRSGGQLYQVWCAMRERCHSPRSVSYARYGGRGIRVCDAWLPENGGFLQFLADVGERPPDPPGWTGGKAYWSIDRIDVNGPYSPENCRWATPSEQEANKQVNARIAELEAENARLRALIPNAQEAFL